MKRNGKKRILFFLSRNWQVTKYFTEVKFGVLLCFFDRRPVVFDHCDLHRIVLNRELSAKQNLTLLEFKISRNFLEE